MTYRYKILVTEDNEAAALNLVKALELRGAHYVSMANSAALAKKLLQDNNFDIAFVDLDLETEKAGYKLLPLLKFHSTYTVIISGHDEDDYIEKSYKHACDDYMVKPFTKQKLDRIFDKVRLANSVEAFRKIVQEEFQTVDPDTIGELKRIEDNLTTSSSFYITGPTGTGKTVLGQAIHRAKYGTLERYVHLNCASIPADLIESELFGTKKGAFTGAVEKDGKLIEANEGTLHLDEVGSMPNTLQDKLLLALDNGIIIPVGGNNKHAVKTKFQLIASTCEPLEEQVASGQFREDLYYRIVGVPIHLKALKDRQGDIAFLVKKFMEEQKRERGLIVRKKALDALLSYNWYGNARELIKFFRVKSDQTRPILDYADLPPYIKNNFNRFAPIQPNFVSNEQLRLIESMSYPAFKKHQEIEVVRYFFAKYGFNKKLARLALGNMTQYTFEKHMKVIERQSGKSLHK